MRAEGGTTRRSNTDRTKVGKNPQLSGVGQSSPGECLVNTISTHYGPVCAGGKFTLFVGKRALGVDHMGASDGTTVMSLFKP